VSSAQFFGVIFFSASLYAQIPAASEIPENHKIYDARNNPMIDRARVPVTASGEAFILDEAPAPARNKPISGIVSLRDLQHPVSKKATKEAYDGQRFARVGKLSKAIAKFEMAIRIDPAYRDAHLDLGVQYARLGRTADARAEFQKALDIGPPAALVYADLALTSLALRHNLEAKTFAQKALDLDPANRAAQQAFEYASSH
jgi:tetratricopeptide (TPR) repeat protein